jgi:hypothetical protein
MNLHCDYICKNGYVRQLNVCIKPLKPTFICIVFKNTACPSDRTPHFIITKINLLMLFKKVIAVYHKKHKKPIRSVPVAARSET